MLHGERVGLPFIRIVNTLKSDILFVFEEPIEFRAEAVET
jgi:hypothetical protein